MRKSAVLLLFATAVLLSACGGGGSSTGGGSGSSSTSPAGGAEAGGTTAAKTPEQVWAKEIEGVMRQFENSSSKSVAVLHTSTSQYNLEPTYATYVKELRALGKELEATDPPPSCEHVRARMGELSRQVSNIFAVLTNQTQLSPEEYAALGFQQRYKFAHVGRRLTNLTINPHC